MKPQHMASIVLVLLFSLVPVLAHGELLVLTPADFMPTLSNVDFWINQGALVKTSGVPATFYAPVHLPQDAKINRVTIYYIHVTLGQHLRITLLRKHLLSRLPTSGNSLVMLENDTTPNGTNARADTIRGAQIRQRTIDNSRYKYLFAVDYPSGGPDLYLSGIKVDYTVPAP